MDGLEAILNKFGWFKDDERHGDAIYKHPALKKPEEEGTDDFWETKVYVNLKEPYEIAFASVISVMGTEGVLFFGKLVTDDKENEILTLLKQTNLPHE